MPAMALGERIKHARESLRMSQQELADRLMVSRDTIINWEKGHTHPRPRDLIALEEILGRLDGGPEDLAAIIGAVRTSTDLPPATKRALLELIGGQPSGRPTLIPSPSEP